MWIYNISNTIFPLQEAETINERIDTVAQTWGDLQSSVSN